MVDRLLHSARLMIVTTLVAEGEQTLDELKAQTRLPKPLILQALQDFLAEGVVTRHGAGRKGDPWRYQRSTVPFTDSPEPPPVLRPKAAPITLKEYRRLHQGYQMLLRGHRLLISPNNQDPTPELTVALVLVQNELKVRKEYLDLFSLDQPLQEE